MFTCKIWLIVLNNRMWRLVLISFLFSFCFSAKPEGQGKSAAPQHLLIDLLSLTLSHTDLIIAVTFSLFTHTSFQVHCQANLLTYDRMCVIMYERHFLSQQHFHFLHASQYASKYSSRKKLILFTVSWQAKEILWNVWKLYMV